MPVLIHVIGTRKIFTRHRLLTWKLNLLSEFKVTSVAYVPITVMSHPPRLVEGGVDLNRAII